MQQRSNLGRVGGCRSTLATTATRGSCSRCADQVYRLVAVAVGDLSAGALPKKVANQIRSTRLHRYVKSRHSFVCRGLAGNAHGLRLRTGDLSIYIRAMLKKQVH